MAAGPALKKINRWAECSTDREMMEKQDTRAWVYKNVIGTYLHGPLLPKNPQLADWLILKALERKYGSGVKLALLDDSQEKEANAYICRRFLK